jgi:hypothetical protein
VRAITTDFITYGDFRAGREGSTRNRKSSGGGGVMQTGGTSKLVPNNTGSFKNKNLQLVFVFKSHVDVLPI